MSTPDAPKDARPNQSQGFSVASRREARLHTAQLTCSQGRVADITASGMRLISPKGELPEVGNTQDYTFDDGFSTLTISGCVKWVRKGSAFSRRAEVGVEFVDLTQGQRDALVRLAVQGKIKQSRDTNPEKTDLYKLLGVTRYASPEQIDKAFDDSSKRWGSEDAHHPKAAQKLDEICKAYAVLSDPEKRANYDKRFADQHDRAA